jgi:SAM-dependent methyltransferase
MTVVIEGMRAQAVPSALTGLSADVVNTENAELRRQIMGFIVSQCIVAVTELGVPDRLAHGSVAVDVLARDTGADQDALHRMLSTLATENLFREESPGVFALTPRGGLLCTATPGSLRHLCTLMSEEAFECWSAATHVLRTGRPGFDEVFGQPYFEWLDQHPRSAARFHRAQAGLVQLRLLPLIELDWSAVRTVVDVGAGDGALLSTLLTAHSKLHGIAVDLATVIDATRARFVEDGLVERTRCIAGDFFQELPDGADRYVMAQILHDWPDDKAVEILRVCRGAMGPEAELVIVEQVIPDDGRAHPARLLDLHMLALLGGRERGVGEWRALLAAAGLRLEHTSTGARSSLLLARRA